MNARRITVGVLALAMLASAAAIWLTGNLDDDRQFLQGVLVRVGIVLATVFLAWPTLERLSGRLPAAVVAAAAGGILLVAIRPRLLLVATVLALAIVIVHFGLRSLSRRLGG